VAQGILFEAGDVFFLAQPAPKNFLRLGFSSIPVDRIEPGISKLAGMAR
jgi:GntR family transcriptional regulator/MocR family aminotransferase